MIFDTIYMFCLLLFYSFPLVYYFIDDDSWILVDGLIVFHLKLRKSHFDLDKISMLCLFLFFPFTLVSYFNEDDSWILANSVDQW